VSTATDGQPPSDPRTAAAPERVLARMRLAAAAAMAAFVMIAVVSAATSPHGLWPLLPFRVGAVAVLGAAYALAGGRLGQRFPMTLVSIPVLATAAEIAVVIHYEGGAESPFFATICLLLVGAGVFIAPRPRSFAMLAALVTAVYVAPIALAGPIPNYARFIAQCSIVAASAIVATIGAYLVSRLERRELEARASLESANRRLQDLDRARTEFFQNVSHELRTPLTLNLTPLDLLLRGEAGVLTADQRRLVEVVRANALELRELVNKLLDLARIDAGAYEPRRAPLAVAVTVERLAARFSDAFREKALGFSVSAGRRDLAVLLDPGILTKVLSNMLGNALKYTDRGEVRLEVAEHPAATGGAGEIEFSVADTGIGIPPEALPRLFERFHRLDTGREGTGIGLAFVKSLIEADGGRIACESTVGRGTTFRVFFPLRPAAAAPAAEPAAGESAAPAGREPVPREAARAGEYGEGAHLVLVVEDNRDLADLLVQMLRRSYRVRWARDGADGLALARELRPDLIVSDIAMPRMSGLDLCRAARADAALAETPILLLTARTETAEQLEGFEAGAVDYLGKPFEPEVLRGKVRALLRIRDLHAALVARERLAAIGEVAVTLAHEVNNALAGITGAAQLLLLEPLPAELREHVSIILNGAGHIAETLEKIRDLREARGTTYVGTTRMIALD
jgi:signal transduction histidine kinase